LDIAEGLVGATSSVMAGGLNDTAGGWLTGGIAQSHLLSAAAHNSDPTLMTATASALYQQQPAAIQQVDILYFSTFTILAGAGIAFGWLTSRVVGMLDSGAEGPGFKSGNSLRQTVHTHRGSVHQAAKLVAALLRVAMVTGGK